MPRAPRSQPATPEVEKAPEAPPKVEVEEEPKKEAAAQRPSQTQQTSAESKVEEGQVPKIELFVPEKISDTDLGKLNVYQRWNRCIGEIGLVPKRGWNAHHRYWFTTDADLMAFIGPLFAKYHIVVLPTILLDKVTRIDPPAGQKQAITRVPMLVRVINADKPEDRFEIEWIGEGADTVDKGVYKAFTGGLKYFYMKLLQVATGDDPELFVRTDQIGQMAAEDASAARGARPETRQVNIRSSNREQPEKGGHQQKATEVQIRQVRALAKGLRMRVDVLAGFTDAILNTSSVNVLDGIEDPEAQRDALLEWMKTREGTDIGKVIYELGEETKRRAAERAENEVAAASNPYGGAPENETVDEAQPDEDDPLAAAAESQQ